MNAKFLVAFLAALIASLSFAQVPQNYQCSYGDLLRRVEIVYETGVAVPCEVHYYKDTEAPGEREVLWSAYNESGYCERNTRELIARLESLGWNCGQGEVAQGEVAQREVPQRDDTEWLTPGKQADDAGPVDDTETRMPGERAESAEDYPQ